MRALVLNPLAALLVPLGLWACAVDARKLKPATSEGGAGEAGRSLLPPEASEGGDGGSAPTSSGGTGASSGSGTNEGGTESTSPSCGDGRLAENEGCDDGGVADRDGCNTVCEPEEGYACAGEPSSCHSCSGAPGQRRCIIAGGAFDLGPPDQRVPAAVSAFQLDELEVTVARFRNYANAFAGAPDAGAGAHPELPGSGWQSEWNDFFPSSRDALLQSLRCNVAWETWTDDVGEREAYPLTCASYYVAFAFCAAQGGRLPTEAEWEYAAKGGAQERAYPWGNTAPSGEEASFNVTALVPAGSFERGAARFGQLDLAGSVWEWSLDFFSPYPATCDRCAALQNGTDRVLRGGSFIGDAEYLQAFYRFAYDPQLSLGNVGIRCAYALDQ